MEPDTIYESFDCVECGQSFPTAEELQQHQRQYPPSRPAEQSRLTGVGRN